MTFTDIESISRTYSIVIFARHSIDLFIYNQDSNKIIHWKIPLAIHISWDNHNHNYNGITIYYIPQSSILLWDNHIITRRIPIPVDAGCQPHRRLDHRDPNALPSASCRHSVINIRMPWDGHVVGIWCRSYLPERDMRQFPNLSEKISAYVCRNVCIYIYIYIYIINQYVYVYIYIHAY